MHGAGVREWRSTPTTRRMSVPARLARSVQQGCNFVLKNISDEAFVYNRKKEPAEYKFQTINPKEMYPYLLVTIGSGMISLNVMLVNMGPF